MKKIFTLFLAIVLISAAAFAQNGYTRDTRTSGLSYQSGYIAGNGFQNSRETWKQTKYSPGEKFDHFRREDFRRRHRFERWEMRHHRARRGFFFRVFPGRRYHRY